jgi:hypothetical protein
VRFGKAAKSRSSQPVLAWPSSWEASLKYSLAGLSGALASSWQVSWRAPFAALRHARALSGGSDWVIDFEPLHPAADSESTIFLLRRECRRHLPLNRPRDGLRTV